jgi:hypothetical protein
MYMTSRYWILIRLSPFVSSPRGSLIPISHWRPGIQQVSLLHGRVCLLLLTSKLRQRIENHERGTAAQQLDKHTADKRGHEAPAKQLG